MRYDAVAFLNGLFQELAGPLEKDNSATAFTLTPADLPGDWHDLWDERAAIMEYDGGLLREHAEAEALKYILEEMRQAGNLGCC